MSTIVICLKLIVNCPNSADTWKLIFEKLQIGTKSHSILELIIPYKLIFNAIPFVEICAKTKRFPVHTGFRRFGVLLLFPLFVQRISQSAWRGKCQGGSPFCVSLNDTLEYNFILSLSIEYNTNWIHSCGRIFSIDYDNN